MSEQLTVADIQCLINKSPFHQLFAPKVLAVDHTLLELVIKMPMQALFERQPGTNQWHGGTISSIVDIAGCYALALISGEPLPTINFRVDYLRPAVETDLTARAQVRRAGRSVAVVDVDLTDDLQRLVAVGRACYSTRGHQNRD